MTSIQILTPNGFKNFGGVKRYWHDESLRFTFDDDTTLKTAFDHRFIVNGLEVFAKDITAGQDIGKRVKSVEAINEGEYFYDPVNVEDGKIYSHDGALVSHNTFHGTGNTLISADVLLALKAESPVYVQDNVKVYQKPEKDRSYMMFVDVAKGRGQDYSTFNIVDVSEQPLVQVATYRDNKISPLLFPDIIYKYAKTYNDCWVVIESNDAGQVVCNGLYYDLEYENMYVESLLSADALGVNMNKKVKRIGCSHMKDLVEQGKLKIVDADTILEMSTFVASGQSYEASDGNHDDLVMNFVLMGWFSATSFFSETVNMKVKEMIFAERARQIEDDLVPFGIIDDGLSDPLMEEKVFGEGDYWQLPKKDDSGDSW